MKKLQRSAWVSSLLAYLSALALALGPYSVLAPFDFVLTLGFWLGAFCLSWLLTTSVQSLPIYLRPLRLLFLLVLWLSCAGYGMRSLALGVELITHQVDAGTNVQILAIERGGFGSTWTDVVERKSFAGILFRDSALAQFQRQSVVDLSHKPGIGWTAQLDEVGKPRTTVLVKIDSN
jgi:hypothetical protein